jgi:hypothetical protein
METRSFQGMLGESLSWYSWSRIRLFTVFATIIDKFLKVIATESIRRRTEPLIRPLRRRLSTPPSSVPRPAWPDWHCLSASPGHNTLLRVLSPKRGDNLGFGSMPRPDFRAGSVLQGGSAFVPRRSSWILNRSQAHFHTLRVSRSDMIDFREKIHIRWCCIDRLSWQVLSESGCRQKPGSEEDL